MTGGVGGVFVPAGLGALHRVEDVMGMPIFIDVCDPQIGEAVVEGAYAWLRFVDATFSTYREDSEISRLNRGELSLDQAHPAVRSVLRRCERLRERTDGYFDARTGADRGGGIDPSGLVKGWSVAGAARLLERAGARNYAINAGGDVLVRGHPQGDRAWRVGIQHPRERDQVAMVLALTGGGVATSGTYERGEHIVDPHTGRPPRGLLSVTVVGPDLATADAYATAAYARGTGAAPWCATLEGYESVVIGEDDIVLSTPGLDRYRT